jgi:hypothetical protein
MSTRPCEAVKVPAFQSSLVGRKHYGDSAILGSEHQNFTQSVQSQVNTQTAFWQNIKDIRSFSFKMYVLIYSIYLHLQYASLLFLSLPFFPIIPILSVKQVARGRWFVWRRLACGAPWGVPGLVQLKGLTLVISCHFPPSILHTVSLTVSICKYPILYI